MIADLFIQAIYDLKLYSDNGFVSRIKRHQIINKLKDSLNRRVLSISYMPSDIVNMCYLADVARALNIYKHDVSSNFKLRLIKGIGRSNWPLTGEIEFFYEDSIISYKSHMNNDTDMNGIIDVRITFNSENEPIKLDYVKKQKSVSKKLTSINYSEDDAQEELLYKLLNEAFTVIVINIIDNLKKKYT